MAKIQAETITINFSKLLKDSDKEELIVTPDILEVIDSLLNDALKEVLAGVLIEVVK